ncbi:MAG: catalase family protein [Pseudomonadota bacterium]
MPDFRILSGLVMMAAVSGCSAKPPENIAAEVDSAEVLAYPEIDPALGERLFPDEAAISEEMAVAIEKSLRHQYGPGSARRDAHPKAHGCVRAEFQVKEKIPDNLAKGIFVPGKTYQAWIRFSNGSRDPTRADIKRDARGMAIKVLSVPGKKLVEDEGQAGTQDFILVNHPVFFANDPKRYLALIKHQGSDSFFRKLLVPFDLGVKGSLIGLKTISKNVANPLQTRYWSMVPYQFGADSDRQAVKYSARSCAAVADKVPDNPGHDFLRDALRGTLQNGDACMEFLVQPRTSESMDVEDAMTEWKESEAPFFPVATLRIPRQVFDTPAQNEFCEDLSFTPWHALPEHKPLGVTNRLRKGIYDHISRVRHEMNRAPRQEPR